MIEEKRIKSALVVLATTALGLMLVVSAVVAGSNQAGNAWAWGLSILSNGSLQTPPLQVGPVAGDLSGALPGAAWYDSARKTHRVTWDAGTGGLTLVFAPPVADSTTLSNPTSLTAFSQKVTLPAGCLTAGKVVRSRSWGKYTTGTSLTPTISVGTRLAGAALAASGLIPTSVSLTNQAWYAESTTVVRTVGAGGTAFALHRTELGGILALTTPTSMIGRSGSFALNTTGSVDVEQSAQFGVSDASNAITMEGFIVEVSN